MHFIMFLLPLDQRWACPFPLDQELSWQRPQWPDRHWCWRLPAASQPHSLSPPSEARFEAASRCFVWRNTESENNFLINVVLRLDNPDLITWCQDPSLKSISQNKYVFSISRISQTHISDYAREWEWRNRWNKIVAAPDSSRTFSTCPADACAHRTQVKSKFYDR